MAMLDDLVPWLRKRINMAWQSALALPYAVGGVTSQWSPERLADQCAMHIALLDHMLASEDPEYRQHGVQLLAWVYRRSSGYREEWAPPGLPPPL